MAANDGDSGGGQARPRSRGVDYVVYALCILATAAAAVAFNWESVRPLVMGPAPAPVQAKAPAPSPDPAPSEPEAPAAETAAPEAAEPATPAAPEASPAPAVAKPKPLPEDAPEFYMPDTDPEPEPVRLPRPAPTAAEAGAAAPKAKPAVPLAAPRVGGAKAPAFLNKELRYLSDAEVACRAGEQWLLKPKGTPPKRVVRAPKARKAPEIDGELGDECWKAAALVKEFVIGEKAEGPKSPPAPEKTEVRIAYDAEFLYIAYKAVDKDIKGLVRNGTETGEKLWLDDSIELFMDINRDYTTYHQIIVNVDGARFEHDGQGGVPETAGLEAVTKVTDDAWVTEMALPLKTLGAIDTKAGFVWGVNFIRNGYVKEEYYGSSWAHLRGGSNHVPAEYGYLIFK